MVDNRDIARWFPVGPPIAEELQVGRANVIDRLEARLRGADKVKLSRGRREGKSSAANAAIDRLRAADLPAAKIDVVRLGTSEAAAVSLAKQLAPGLAARARAHQATGWLADRLKEVLDTEERVAAGFLADLLQTTASPAGILQRAAEGSEGEPIGVLLDEAHHIATWPEAEHLALQDFLRTDRRVGIIVASSRRSAMRALYQDGGPLQYTGETVELDAIPLDDWRRELPVRFDRVAAPVTADAVEQILHETGGHAGCTMLLARACARVGANYEVTTATVDLVLPEVRMDEMWRLLDPEFEADDDRPG